MSQLLIEQRDGVALVTFNRPDRLNAFGRATYEELREIVERIDTETGWQAVVFTGAGRAFCAGQDLTEVSDQPVAREAIGAIVDGIQAITRAIAKATKPTLCAINGPAVGFGVEMTLACDLRLAAPEAYLMLPELRHGLFHTNGTYHYLPRLAGQGLAADMILTGRRVSAEEACRAGLVSRVVPEDRLLEETMALAASLVAVPARALALARQGLRNMTLRARLEESLGFETAACLELLTKRPPWE